MNTTHIVFFTQLYYPDMTTTAIIMTDLVEDLAAYGMNAEVVCAQPTYIRDLGIEELRNSGSRLNIIAKAFNGVRTGRLADSGKSLRSEWHNGVSIRRVWSSLFDKNKNIGRILNGTSCFLSMLPLVFSAGNNTLLVFNTNPALLPLLGLVGAKLRGKKYVILIHDLWPELPANMGMIKKDSALYRAIDFLNNLSFKYANAIIVLSEAMKRRISDKVPRMKDKIHIIHNWVDGSRVCPVAKENNRMLEEFGFGEKKVVMYSGNLGRYQPLEVMIDAANELRGRKDILFLFAGDGGKKKMIQEMATSMNLDNVIFIPFQPLDRLGELLAMADVSLVGIYPENEGVIMPSKLYGLLAVGKPIICVSDRASEVVETLKAADAGIHSPIDDPKELARKIEKVLDNKDRAVKMGENGRRYFLEHFERKKITGEWMSLLTNLHSAD
jgi:glycosyltransferase involved in cell wall biosynthesis